ncbi:MAG: arsenate reductase ArsC [Chloroflexi bacterium]|nr:arsenate reductase ArsC [Chloroflexota bacterium]
MTKRRALFLCTGNSSRSQMAEAPVYALLGDTWQAASAGTHPAPQVNPLAVQAMAELGLDVSAAQPKRVDGFRGEPFDLVVTLCDDAAGNCPLWLGRGAVVHMGLPDPTAVEGDEPQRLAAFRAVRDGIREKVATLSAWTEPPPANLGLDLQRKM